ncbi:hypothetical protein PybrP1_004540 [[Pythium] brassicae (nom. inval.)]|nr:hypothetical protein PybrP1_004540 [[Pythium] brassicae (nom. inval.)]
MLSRPQPPRAAWSGAETPPPLLSPRPGGAQRVRLRLTKQSGERSFGLTLEQRISPPSAVAAVVSYVFPDSPAARVGLQRGWLLLRINKLSVEGLTVKEVAPMFRDLVEIELELEPRPYSLATPADPTGSFAARAEAIPHHPQVAARAPAAAAAAPTRARAVLSPGSALGVAPLDVAVVALPPRAVAAPAKKRARPVESHPAPSATDTAAPSSKGGRVTPRHRNTVPDESESSDDDAEHSSRRPSRSRRGGRGGRSGSTGRKRVSLTVDRLVTMGFTRDDANASVAACGHDVDACMVWIVSHIEDRRFQEDLNQASIQSELSKRAEEKEHKQREQETMKKAKEFTALFSTSYMLSDESTAALVKEMLSGAIGDAPPDSFLRVVFTKLLHLEAQAIKWYKDASRCYFLQLAERLETRFAGHDAARCCAAVLEGDGAGAVASRGCAFLQLLCDEERQLTKVLFIPSENHGGVPLEFLKANKDLHFSLDDDGFEVLEVEPGGH